MKASISRFPLIRLERHIEPGFAPGMLGLVASGPEVETFVLGTMAFEGPTRCRPGGRLPSRIC